MPSAQAPASSSRVAPVDAAIRAASPGGGTTTKPGVAVSSVGVGLLAEAHRRKGEAEAAPTEQGYRDALEGAPTLSRAGIAILAGGAALMVAGIVRFSVLAGREGRERAAEGPIGRSGRCILRRCSARTGSPSASPSGSG